ncbi:tail assembly protein [Methylovulum psychrotolerans]|uniref:hypothetical protein n=1 Tax=Methylovulum psychrotolerans TaxID=1704499 RepID=UPI001BFF9960|nr:hypothetical protein [Methylovulum psychrotolerans]MBT9097517.1 tail assembly protein [Methylovulum psychrotolerans]
MLTTVKLYGHLRQQFGGVFTFDIDRVGEAISALDCNLSGFRAYLLAHSAPGYRVLVDDAPVMAFEELDFSIAIPRTIKIVPVVQGADSGKAIGQIILGVALVALAAFGGVAAAAAYFGASAATAASLAVGVGLMGLSMVAGGVTQLLSSVPSSAGARQANNTVFSNGQSTIQQGLRVPICYGIIMAEGLPISVRLVVENG